MSRQSIHHRGTEITQRTTETAFLTNHFNAASSDERSSNRVHRIESGAHQHLFAVKRPAFDKNSIGMLTTNFVWQMIRDRELQEVSGNSFVAQNRPRIFDGCADVEILALRIVGWNEIESAR